jgi:glutamate carboxypeptidase
MNKKQGVKIRRYLKDQKKAMLRFLEELVLIKSHPTEPEGTNAVGDAVCRELENVGFSTRRVSGERVPAKKRWLEEVMIPGYDQQKLGYHRIGKFRTKGKGRILLLGDLDTAFLPAKWRQFSFHLKGERAIGPGVADMKGGLAVAVYALKALQETGHNNLEEITCVFSSDEQAGSLTSRNIIEEAAKKVDWVFCMECARNGGNIIGSRAQIGVAKLETFGREAHAGSNYAKGVNAIEAMARKITAIHNLTNLDREIYLCVGTVNGGWRRTVIPGHCSALIDIRTPTARIWKEVEAALKYISDKEEIPGSKSLLLIESHRPAVPWTARTTRLIAVAKEAGREIGLRFGVIRSPAAGSSAFIGPSGKPCLDGMGPVGGDLMTEKEHIIIPTLLDRAVLLATIMYKLGSGKY